MITFTKENVDALLHEYEEALNNAESICDWMIVVRHEDCFAMVQIEHSGCALVNMQALCAARPYPNRGPDIVVNSLLLEGASVWLSKSFKERCKFMAEFNDGLPPADQRLIITTH